MSQKMGEFFIKRQEPKKDVNATTTSSYAPPTTKFTGQQLFYLLCLDGIGGMVFSAGINLTTAYVMYRAANDSSIPIRLFHLPITLAGDAAVTIIAHCISTWFIKYGLVPFDLRRRLVQPIGFINEPVSKAMRWYMFLSPRRGSRIEPVRINSFKLAAQHAMKVFVLAVAFFIIFWPASVGALTAFGVRDRDEYTYDTIWVPLIFKAVLGGLLGLLTTPLLSLFWLVRSGWEANQGE